MAHETKFTPGPWGPDGTGWVMGDNGDEPVAMVNASGGLSEREIADLHLISAAPDMYEALERLCTLNDEHGPFGGEMHQDRIDRAWDKAKAAVAKARGES